ncbi:hypothetical protein [Vibrio rumoiensis]|uniref:hypothetical protein n=1 Tax=Vibrio rumoiensis TaxID=76258 RepID=UPI003AA9C198
MGPAILPPENTKHLEISFKTEIEYHMAIKYVHSNIAGFHYSHPIVGATEKSQLHEMLNEQLKATGNLSDDIKKQITSHIESSRITEEDLPWFDKNDARLCFFIWYKCIKTTIITTQNGNNSTITMGEIRNIMGKQTYSPLYLSLIKEQKSPTIKTCFNETLHFLNMLTYEGILRINIIDIITSQFEAYKAKTHQLDLPWITNKEIDNIWAIDSIHKFLEKFNFKHEFTFPHNVSKDNFNNLITLAFDTSESIPDVDKLKELQRLKKAWQQKKYRATLDNKNRKTHQITMSKGIDDKISFIKSKLEEKANSNSELHNKRIFTKNEIIEWLINEEYKRQKDS